jgi:hypothetical protein
MWGWLHYVAPHILLHFTLNYIASYCITLIAKPRPSFRAINSTAPTFGHVPTSTQHGKRPTSRLRPEWGARRPVPKAGLIPMMMLNDAKWRDGLCCLGGMVVISCDYTIGMDALIRVMGN